MIKKTLKHSGNKGVFSQLVVMIIIIAAGLLILLFVSKFIGKSSFEAAINHCRVTVIAQSATEIISSSPLNIDCEKRYMTFFDSRVELGLNPENKKVQSVVIDKEKVKRFNGLNDFIVNQVVAEEMRICWFEFAEGKLDVFVNSDKLFSGKNICFQCTQIDFEDTVKTEKFYGFMDYLKDTRVDETKTYYQYFNEPSRSKITWEEHITDQKNPANLNDFVFDKNKEYAVVFIRDQKVFKDNYYVELVGLGNTDANDINNICDYQAN